MQVQQQPVCSSIARSQYTTTWYILFASAHSDWYRFPFNGHYRPPTSIILLANISTTNQKCIEPKVTREKSCLAEILIRHARSFHSDSGECCCTGLPLPSVAASEFMIYASQYLYTISYGNVVSNCHVENAIEMRSSDSIKSKTSLETEIMFPPHLSLT